MRAPALLSVLLFVGCSAADPDATERVAAPVTPAELAQAKAVTGLVKTRCSTCHTAGKVEIRRWGQAMQAVRAACLAPELPLTKAERIACLRSDPADPASAFSEGKLGFYAAATSHASFRGLFEGQPEAHAALEADAAMPPLFATAAPRYTEAELATLEGWVLAGMPALDEAMTDTSAPCVPVTSPRLAAHVAEMRTAGWAARHVEASTPMFGCAPGADPSACLSGFPDVTAARGVAGVPQTIRKVYELPFSTYAWTRSSADGRFSAFGGQPARIVDLGAPGGPRAITVAAEFDPAFLPDNSGFSYANRSGSRVHVCRQSVLLDATARPTPSISLTEPGCTAVTSADYQAVGASLDGTFFLMASGTHENDVTFSLTHGPLSGSFGSSATTNVLPFVSNGAGWVERSRIPVAHPFEGDGGLSPSSRLLYTRFGSAAGKRGFRVRALNAQSTSTGMTLQTEELATICASGGKVFPSYDERYIVTHTYVDAAEGTGLPNNSANILLFDLVTGETIRLTTLARGEYAFSPVFRADGWIYFLIKDANTRKETLYASDAAVRRP